MKNRKPLIKAKPLKWTALDRSHEIQYCVPAIGLELSISYGKFSVKSFNQYDVFIVHEQQFSEKGKTERAKAAAQKWWNRFVRSLRSGLEVSNLNSD